MSYNFTVIEKKWQQYWLDFASFRALEPAQAGDMPKAFILDMFPYPSGEGLHVGHPVGYTATDIISRYLRMRGFNVLHPMGWDAFGLPAEQYAIKNNQHPKVSTERNIANIRRQFRMLGLSYDWDREIDTTDPGYYRWTQWIFLQLFNSYFDPVDQKAKPVSHLLNELQNQHLVVAPDGSIHINPVHEGMEPISGEVRVERLWHDLTDGERREVIDGQRLAYMDDLPVNWCPELGTVLANEEVINGKSERGGFPVIKQPMRQWVLRITAYADRLLDDLGPINWPESLKEMQREWIGKSIGAEVDFDVDQNEVDIITVFTTRPDTLYGATYMVLSPEHELVTKITTETQRREVEDYRKLVSARSERDRMADTKDKTGVFTGAYAVNPVNDEKIPIWIADYVLMGYGTGAIMAVPAHDERDFEFARKFGLPIRAVVKPPEEWLKSHARGLPPSIAPGEQYEKDPASFGVAYPGEGIAINSLAINGNVTREAKEMMIEILDAEGVGHRSVKYKLRDWLFSRQRYWGEPFPIILDAMGSAWAIPENQLPVTLPEVDDFKPTGTPEPPLSKVRSWVNVQLDGQPAVRETNTMPQWAGSCWYYLRYIDPGNPNQFVDPEKERYWMPVDLYVGGVEHAVLHLLYARFWHKVLYDLGHVSTPEPFKRLVNQGLILGETEFQAFSAAAGVDGAYVSATQAREISEEVIDGNPTLVASERQTGAKLVGKRVEPDQVEKRGEHFVLKSDPTVVVESRSFKMSKSRGNVVNPDQIVQDYGADTFRLYEMYMGPLEAQKPWNTRDIVGMSRFLASVYRNLVGDEQANTFAKIVTKPIPDALNRQMHRTIKKVSSDIENLRLNTAIAELIKLNNEIGRLPEVPRELAENFVLLLAPFAPHLAEEIWRDLEHEESLSRGPWPTFDPNQLIDSTMELPVQVNGKLRGTVTIAADADKEAVLRAARQVDSVKGWLEGKTLAKELYIERKLVNFVVK